MAQFTIQQWVEELDRRTAKIEQGDALEIAVRSTMATHMIPRIFESGEGKSGSYKSSGRGIYVSDDRAPRKVNNTGKNGATIKTGFYKSYADFRRAMGRQTSFVDFKLFGDLLSDFANARVDTTSAKLLGDPKPVKIGANKFAIILKRPLNAKKRQGLEAKYGEVMAPTSEERQVISNLFTINAEAIVNGQAIQ